MEKPWISVVVVVVALFLRKGKCEREDKIFCAIFLCFVVVVAMFFFDFICYSSLFFRLIYYFLYEIKTR